MAEAREEARGERGKDGVNGDLKRQVEGGRSISELVYKWRNIRIACLIFAAGRESRRGRLKIDISAQVYCNNEQ